MYKTIQIKYKSNLSNTYLTNPPLSQRARVSHSNILLPWLWVSGEVAQLYCGAKTARHHLFLGPIGEGGGGGRSLAQSQLLRAVSTWVLKLQGWRSQPLWAESLF